MPNGYGPNTKIQVNGPNGPVEMTLSQLMVATKVNDTEEDVPFEKVLADYQKGTAGSKRLAEAAAKEKALAAREQSLDEQLRTAALVSKLRSGDAAEKAEAFKKFAVDIMGESPESVEAFMQGNNGHLAGNTGGNGMGSANQPIMLEDKHLPPWLQEIKAHMTKEQLTPAQLIASIRGSGRATDHYLESTAEEQINEALDKDPVLRLYYNARNDADGSARKEFVENVSGEFKRTGKFRDTLANHMAKQKAVVTRTAKAITAMTPGLGPAANTNPFITAGVDDEGPPKLDKCKSVEDYITKGLRWASNVEAAGGTSLD